MHVAPPVDRDDADALVRSADAAMWAGDYDRAIADYSSAVRLQSAAGDNRQAAVTCTQLFAMFNTRMFNKVAGRPWYARAVRLVQDEPPCLEQGYVALAGLGCDVDDPAVLQERAELALDRARRFGDIDLEMKALADGGLAHVRAGRVADGMAMIDEAMALACGGATDRSVVARSVCSFFTACHTVADFERVEAWSAVLREHGIIADGPGPQAFTSSHCASVRGTLLCDVGRWGEAQDLLERAYEDVERLMPGIGWHPPIALADLRVRQGRLAEAEALLLGRDDHMEALLPTARLHLARGDFELARATARRGLRVIGDDRVRAATLLGVLVEAELGRRDLVHAAEAAAELAARSAGLGVPALAADAARHQARVQAAQGDVAGGIATLQAGLDGLAGLDLPLLRMSVHLDLARLHEAAGDQAEAVLDARTATALLARLDVVVSADDAALLDRLGAERPARAATGGCRVATMARDGDWWTVGCADTSVRLARAFGLGGRERKASNPAEKARLNVTRAIRKATARLVEALPEAGAVLDRRVKTGVFCSYEPHPDDEILWSVHPLVNGNPRR